MSLARPRRSRRRVVRDFFQPRPRALASCARRASLVQMREKHHARRVLLGSLARRERLVVPGARPARQNRPAHAQVVETSFRRETIRLPTQSSRKLCRKTTASGVALVNSTLPAKSHGQSPLEVKRRNFCNVSETVNDQISPHLAAVHRKTHHGGNAETRSQ